MAKLISVNTLTPVFSKFQSDEYDGAFLDLRPRIAVVTNVEWEHVDIFPDEVRRSAVWGTTFCSKERLRKSRSMSYCGAC